jgi:sugar lactone lactonase YvrE
MAQPRKSFATCFALLAGIISAHAATPITEITLPGSRLFTESLTSTKDGTLIVGSVGKGTVSRIAPGTTNVEEWIHPGANGLKQVFGVYADEPHKTLWVCSFDSAPHGAVLKTFDLKTAAPKGSFTLPGDKAFCNDIAVASNGTAYIADTGQAAVYLLRPGSSTLETAASDPLLKGVDGIAFGEHAALYVNSYDNGTLLRINLGKDGKSTKITDLKLSRHLDRPDGMRTLGKNRFLLAENSGDMDIVTVTGNNAKVETIKSGLESTPAVTAARGMAWIAEGKLNYMDDAALKDRNPDPFKLYAVPLPKP